jgi:hypothetical protein
MDLRLESFCELNRLAADYWQQLNRTQSKGEAKPAFDLLFAVHEARATGSLADMLEQSLKEGRISLAAFCCVTPSPFADSVNEQALDLLEQRIPYQGLAVIIKAVADCKDPLPESLLQGLINSIHSSFSAKRDVFNKYSIAAIKSVAHEAFETNTKNCPSYKFLQLLIEKQSSDPSEIKKMLVNRAMSSMWDSIIDRSFPVGSRNLESALVFTRSLSGPARALVNSALTYSVSTMIDDQVSNSRCNAINTLLLDGRDELSSVRHAVILAVNENYSDQHYLVAALDLVDLCIPVAKQAGRPFNCCEPDFLTKGVLDGSEVARLRKISGFDLDRLDVHALPIMGKRAFAEYEWGV